MSPSHTEKRLVGENGQSVYLKLTSTNTVQPRQNETKAGILQSNPESLP